jgi:outer membrane protein OmpA-like peptidoglycan-associated protein
VRDERRLARGPFLPTRLAALTLTLCAALAGCGGESDDEVEEPATATVEEARPAAPDPEPTAPDVPPVERLDAIPLMPGLTVVTAVTQSLGDFESVKQIASVDDEGYWIHYSADGVDRAGQSRTVRARRKVLWEDLRSAPSYRLPFGEEEPELVPGTTAISVSTAVFEGIRDDGTGTLQVIGNLTPEQAASALVAGDSEFTGTVSVVGEEPFPTIVNGVPSLLPAVRIRGRLTDDVALEPFEFEGVFLDDARHPLALRWRLAEQGIDVVRVDWTGEATFDLLEERLSLGQSVALHGIYFDFGSATLRPESEFVLDGLASILREHPDWRIRIEGHTDDIGDVSANLALSERRAGAVRQALIDRLGDGPERFEVVGLGESRPVATNETLEGRALNRRVELARIEG